MTYSEVPVLLRSFPFVWPVGKKKYQPISNHVRSLKAMTNTRYPITLSRISLSFLVYSSSEEFFLSFVVNENYWIPDVLVLTVASDHTNGYERFLRSAKIFDIPVKNLGEGIEWRGGSMKSTGGGQKINLFREEVEKYKNDEEKLILFTDAWVSDFCCLRIE